MKEYEFLQRPFLMLRCPKVIRVDMKAGHSFTRGFERPFDEIFAQCMCETAKALCRQINGAVFAFVQSDEISVIINDMKDPASPNCFFNGNVNKIVSVAASIATAEFNKAYFRLVQPIPEFHKREKYAANFFKALFDARVFCLPNVKEVYNYVLWRQNDASINSVQMAAHAVFDEEDVRGKDLSELQDMLMLRQGINWNDYQEYFKRGGLVARVPFTKRSPDGTKEVVRKKWARVETPIFSQDPEFAAKLFEEEAKLKETGFLGTGSSVKGEVYE